MCPGPIPYVYPCICAATPSHGIKVLDSSMCSFIFFPHLSVGLTHSQLHTAHGLPFPNHHAQLAKYAERWQGLMAAYDSTGAGQVGQRIVSVLIHHPACCLLDRFITMHRFSIFMRTLLLVDNYVSNKLPQCAMHALERHACLPRPIHCIC